jgi:hypothetical protein
MAEICHLSCLVVGKASQRVADPMIGHSYELLGASADQDGAVLLLRVVSRHS